MSSEYRRYEKFVRIVKRISVENEGGAAIIVEGMNDEAALRQIGFKGRILHFKSSGLTLVDFIDKIRSKRAIVLTDFDREGVELAARITEELTHQGITVNSALRKQLASMVKPETTKIEGLQTFIQRMQSKVSWPGC